MLHNVTTPVNFGARRPINSDNYTLEGMEKASEEKTTPEGDAFNSEASKAEQGSDKDLGAGALLAGGAGIAAISAAVTKALSGQFIPITQDLKRIRSDMYDMQKGLTNVTKKVDDLSKNLTDAVDGLNNSNTALRSQMDRIIADNNNRGGLLKFLGTKNGKIAIFATAGVAVLSAAAVIYSKYKKAKADKVNVAAEYNPAQSTPAPTAAPNIAPVTVVAPIPIPDVQPVPSSISDYFIKSA